MAHKKAGGSSRNGRDSDGRRLGVKKFGGEQVIGGMIIVRQRGTKFHPGRNVGIGVDHTLFATAAGKVAFETKANGRAIRNGRRAQSGGIDGGGGRDPRRGAQPPRTVSRTIPENMKARKPSSKSPVSRRAYEGEAGRRIPFVVSGPASREAPAGPEPTMFPDLARDDVFRLETTRLWLRWPRVADAAAIERYSSRWEVARCTARIPHPYPPGDGRALHLRRARGQCAWAAI